MMDEMIEVKKPNIIVRFLQMIGGKTHQAVDYVVDISKDILAAFLPFLRTEAAQFVKLYRDYAIKVALEAAKLCVSNKEKVAYFGKQMIAYLKSDGVMDVKDHLINLLREIVVAELKSKKLV